MATDLYAKCPCGSGKKIKFCCRDIISDIERIERMLRGEQRTAALEKIDKLLAKHPDRAALLSLKAQLFFELKQPDDARPVVQRLLEVEEDNPTGLAMKATLTALEGDTGQALKLLHRAMRMSSGVLSQVVYNSYLSICVHLIQLEELIAAYAHLMTLVSITKGADRSCVSMLMNVTGSERLPTIFQGLVISDQCPEGVTWKLEFDMAIDRYRYGDWSEAASMLEDMNARILDEPVLLRNLAILQAWTLQSEKAVKSFRMYAQLRGLELEDAVEAEACAQVLEPTADEDMDDVVQLTHQIDNADDLVEKLLSSDLISSVPIDDHSGEEGGPPPKGQFVLYDRPLPGTADAAATAVADLPQQRCSMTVYGRETDRPARLLILLFTDERYANNLSQIGEIVGETIDGNATENIEYLANVHKIQRLFRANFHLPPEAGIDRYNQFLREWTCDQLENVWPKMPLASFGGQSAVEAAQDKKYQRVVLAAIMNLELWSDRQPIGFDFNQLRGKLGLPIREPLDPASIDIRSLSPTRLTALELEKLTDDDLVFLFKVTSVRPNGGFLHKLGLEVLKRPHLSDRIDFIEVHERLAELASTTDDTLEHVRHARDIAVGRGESPAQWLVNELDLRLMRGEIDVAKRLVKEIQSRYLREPGIGQLFAGVLSKYGIMPAAAPVEAADATPQVEAATDAPTGVWTPDGETTSSEEGSAEKSKLWVPGMD